MLVNPSRLYGGFHLLGGRKVLICCLCTGGYGAVCVYMFSPETGIGELNNFEYMTKIREEHDVTWFCPFIYPLSSLNSVSRK